jgi:hypothetical protein
MPICKTLENFNPTLFKTKLTTWKKEVLKYGYLDNRNIKRIALTNEQQRDYHADYRYI